MNMNMQSYKGSTNKQGKSRLSPCVLFLFAELCCCFINNHKALFIADYYLPLLLFVVFAVIERHWTIRAHPLVVSMIAIMGSSLVFKNMVDRGTFLSYFVWFVVMIVGLQCKFSPKDLSFIMWGAILGSVIMAILVLIQQHHFYYPGSYRFTFQVLDNIEIDPNYLAAFLYMGIAFSTFLFFDKKGIRQRILLLVCFMIILIAIFMTGSRAVYVALAVAFLGVFLHVFKKAKKKPGILLVFGAICLALIVVLSTRLSDEILERFNLAALFDDSNMKRLQHWKAALFAFLKSPLIGYGASHTMTILSTVSSHSGDAHNTFLTILLHFGAVGSIPIFSLLLKIFNCFRKQTNKVWLYYFFGFLFTNFIIANHLGISFWIPLLVFYRLGERKEL